LAGADVPDTVPRDAGPIGDCGISKGNHFASSSHEVIRGTTEASRKAMNKTFYAESARDVLLLTARILMALLFVIFGWQKLTNYGGTVAYFVQGNVPVPALSAVIAIIAELGAGIAIVLGIFTRPVAILLALYTFATALLGHHYWSMSGLARFESEINFFKNLSIISGLLLLYLTGAGRYSVDDKIDLG
jgi:putative oxidoreductase